jgi:hypothetical protein
MLVEALVQAIAPTIDLRTLHAASWEIRRHLREPPRKRAYQNPRPHW